jgi:hypothetical protein
MPNRLCKTSQTGKDANFNENNFEKILRIRGRSASGNCLYSRRENAHPNDTREKCETG